MEHISRADRICAVAAAAAHGLNEELTIVLNAIHAAQQDPDLSEQMLSEAMRAVGRCAWRVNSLLHFCRRKGASPSSVTLEQLLNDEIPT